MKRTCAVIWALALFSFILPVAAGAADPSHFSLAVGIKCTTCHQYNRTFGDLWSGNGSSVPAGTPIIRSSPGAYNNICQQCHRTGDGFAKAKPMALVDTSDIFGGHSTANFGKLRQTSHRWDGTTENKAAGAQRPILAAMTTNTNGTLDLHGRSGYELACVRCHSPHLTDAPGKMLRAPIDQDQMCFDCHRSRNQQSHLSGTHPVNVNYDSAKGSFSRPNPQNANPANPTSDMTNYLTQTVPTRNVVCTTCHGIHYTDSRSSTFDGASTAKGKGNYINLSTGDGYQLHTDRRGSKVTYPAQDKLNICTNCHANKKSHNAKNQDVQCNDCHGAHVEYDPNDPTNSKGTNVYLIRRNVKNGGMPSSIYFRYTGNQREYKNDAGTGVCQGCHVVPEPGGKYPIEHDSNKASDCNKCHFHSSAAGSFSGSCGQCHSASGGLVTTANTTNATGGLPGAHSKHVNGALTMECNTCHSGYAYGDSLIHMNFQINGANVPGFTNVLNAGTYNNTNAQLTNGYIWAGPGVVTTGARTIQTCDNIYCHGATLTGGTKSNPSWIGGSTEIQCGTCHGATAAAPPTTAGHNRHAGAAAGQLQIPCASCHGVITADNKHVNGDVKWNFAGLNGGQYKTQSGRFYNISGSTGRLAPSSSYGTCNTLYCHSNGGPNGTALVYSTVTWGGAALTCGSCHANMATTAAANGGHFKHSSTGNAGGPAFDCSICHSGYTASTTNGATHANKLVELIATITGYSKIAPISASGAWGTCSTNQCHGQATGVTWGDTATIWQTGGDRCSTCHSSTTGVTVGTPFYSTEFPTKQILNTNAKVGAHTYHATNIQMMGTSLVCADCHGPVALKDATHMNGVTNFKWNKFANHSGATSPSYNPVTGVCSNVYCHGAGLSADTAVGVNRTPSWKTPFMPPTLTPASCKTCHGFPPVTATHQNFASPTSFPTAACTTCHPNVRATGTTYADIFVNKAHHINGQIEGGGCNGCHGYPPTNKRFIGGTGNYVDARIENYSGGGGAHTVPGHISPNATISQQWANCTNCHNQADHVTSPVVFNPSSNIKININMRNRFSDDRTPKYTSNKLDGNLHVSGNCSNIACHFQKTPKW
jgi:predicted CxxxxCH...CXXCH cytochrome family protein